MIDLTQQLENHEGKPLQGEKECYVVSESGKLIKKDGSPVIMTLSTPDEILTVRKVLTDALLNGSDIDTAGAGEKVKRYDIWMKIRDKKEIKFEPEEALKCKELVGKSYATIVVGQIDKILNG